MKFSCRMFLLEIHKTLGLFVNILTADDKYSLLINDKLVQTIQVQLSNKKTLFANFFYVFEI